MLAMRHVARFAVLFGLGLALVAAALVHSVQPVGATPACTDSWKAAVNGSWTDGTKWSSGAPPIGADDVCLPGLSGSYTVSLTAGTTIHSLNIAGSGVNTTTLLVAGVGCQSDTSLSIGTDVAVLASGTLDLTNLVGTCTAGQIAMVTWGGTLTNSGTVTSEAGAAGGSRYLRGNLTNNGSLTINTPTAFDTASAVLINNGSTNIGTGATLSISGGTFTNVGTIATTGSGAVAVTNGGTFNQGANSAGTNPVSLDASNLNLNGSGAGSFVFISNGNLTGSISAAQQLTIESRSGLNDTTVAATGPFTNAGSIMVTNVQGTVLQGQITIFSWSGTLTNTGTIATAYGAAGGPRYLRGSLNNGGVLNVGGDTRYDATSAVFTNNGGGSAVNVTSYLLTFSSATVTNNGAFSLANGTQLVLKNNSTFTNTSGISGSGSANISLVASTFNQGANPAGNNQTTLDGSTLNLNGPGAGDFVFISNGNLSGNISAAQHVTVEGRGQLSDTTVTAPSDFTNAGTIVLTNAVGNLAQGQIADLTWTGTLTNAGSITTNIGAAGGSRYLRGKLANQATLNILWPTNFDGSFTTLTNTGTTNLGTSATLSLVGTTFTNSGSIVTSGTGAVAVTSGTFNQGANSAGTNPVSLDASNLNLNGSGAGSFVFVSNGNLTGSISAAQQLTIESRGQINDTAVTATGPFTNAGTITLTNIVGNIAQGQVTQFGWSGKLTNHGTLTTALGAAGGTRYLRGTVTNSGTINVNTTTTFDASSTVLTNAKTLMIGNGAVLAITGSTLTNTGTITTTGTGYVAVSGGTFNQGAKSAGTNAATLSASNLNLAGAGPGGWVFLSGGNISGNLGAKQRVTIESRGQLNDTTVTATSPFTNAGTITLTNIVGNIAQGQSTSLAWPGTLTNTGALNSVLGAAGGTRYLRGGLTNIGGTVSIGMNTNFDVSGAAFNNAGTLKVAAGANLVMGGSQTYTQQAGGTFEPTIDATAGQGQLVGASSATLAGTLKVDTAGEPAAGIVYPLIGAGTLSGTFATLNFQQEGYVASYSSTQATILVDAEPSITSLSRRALVQGSTNKVITVSGANFSPSITASFSGTGITINNFTFVSSTKLTLTVTVSASAPVGPQLVTVVNPDQGAASSKFTVDPPPAPSSASPNALGQGATAQTVVLSGTGFVTGDKASFSGTGTTVNSAVVVSLTQLRLSVTVSPTAVTGLRSITVSNSDGGVGTCTNCFTVDAGPSVTGASPSSVARGTINQNVVITGTNFVNGATVSFSSSGITVNSVTWNSATQITVNITVSSTATTGACTITVVNPDSGQGSSSTVFTIT